MILHHDITVCTLQDTTGHKPLSETANTKVNAKKLRQKYFKRLIDCSKYVLFILIIEFKCCPVWSQYLILKINYSY